MKYLSFLPVAGALLMFACKVKPPQTVEALEERMLDTFVVSAVPEPPVYKGSAKRVNDIIHTKLDLSFDWDSAFVFGKATLTAKAYNLPVNSITLDAKGYTIHEVKTGSENQMNVVTYNYDGNVLTVNLDRTYSKNENYQVYIHYTAKPDQRRTKAGTAISSDKGLYFIKRKDETRQQWQLWTQGEPEANSAWFPTIDAPNERMTQEIYLTVDTIYETLSNGVLVFQTDNGDGSRTDYWKMEQGHAPYLAMIAVGDFSIYNDRWRELPVNYYVDPEYAQYAHDIFGATPNMLEFYSNLLGVDYPWPSYSQVVVKDFVSGAMENTTAVTHGEFLHQTNRERLDGDYEDFIAHELFHHWFGDLVTCESWANLPLNESFATYGEYLWIHHRYGADAADYHLYKDLRSYLLQSATLPRKMIRYDYEEIDDMFDAHSYQKGGRILHLLRNYLGDELFFSSITLYLKRFAYQSVEIHQLRQVFEEVSGEDLTWFFDQWFFHEGHPELNITTTYLPDSGKVKVVVEQEQNFNLYPLFRFPLKIDVYAGGGKKRYSETIKKAEEVFYYEVATQPDLVNVDAEKLLICEKREQRTLAEWQFMYRNAPLFLDRYEAVSELSKRNDSVACTALLEAFKDPFWKIREMAASGVSFLAARGDQQIKEALMNRLQNDSNAAVRATALRTLAEYYTDPNLIGLYEGAVSDSSYEVMAAGLTALVEKDEDRGMAIAKGLEQEKNATIIGGVTTLYAKKGGAKENAYFMKVKSLLSSFERYTYINDYCDYLKRQNDSIAQLGIQVLADIAMEDKQWWIRLSSVNALKMMEAKYEGRITSAQEKIEGMEATDKEYATYQQMLSSAQSVQTLIREALAQLKEEEADERVRKALERE